METIYSSVSLIEHIDVLLTARMLLSTISYAALFFLLCLSSTAFILFCVSDRTMKTSVEWTTNAIKIERYFNKNSTKNCLLNEYSSHGNVHRTVKYFPIHIDWHWSLFLHKPSLTCVSKMAATVLQNGQSSSQA